MAVVIAAYNRASWVGLAVATAIEQRPDPPAEVIVVDDGSTDGTGAAARAAGARVVRHERNLGAAAARNTGAAATEQPWIAPLNSDDRWLPHMLGCLWPLRGGYGFVAGASLAMDGNDQPVAYGGPLAPEPVVLGSPAPLIYPENFIVASGVIVRRDIFCAVGGYRTAQHQPEDFDLWIRMLQVAPGLSVPRVVTLYSVHSGQKSRGGTASRQAVLDVVQRYRDQDWCRRELVESRRAVLAWDDMREAWAARRVWHAFSQGRWLLAGRLRRRAVWTTLVRRRETRNRARNCTAAGHFGPN